jgi:hypothetical protein
MAKQLEEVGKLRQAAGLKTVAAEKFILDSKSDTKKKMSLERSISKSTKDNLKSKMSVLKTSVSLLQEKFDEERKILVQRHMKKMEDEADCCNKAPKKQADESNLRIASHESHCNLLNEQLEGYCASYRAKEHHVATTQLADIASLKVDLKSNYRDQLKDKSSKLITQKNKVIGDLKSEVCLLKQAAMKAEMKFVSAESYARECLKQTNRTEDVAGSQLLEDNFQLIDHNQAEIEQLKCIVKKI